MLGQYVYNGKKLFMEIHNDVIFSEWEGDDLLSIESYDTIEEANEFLGKLGLSPLPIPTETMEVDKWYTVNNPCEWYLKGYSMMDRDKKYKTLLVHPNNDGTYDVVLFDHYTLTPLEMLEMLQDYSKEKDCENPSLHDSVTFRATDHGYSGMDMIYRDRDTVGVSEILSLYGVTDSFKGV